MDTLKATHKTKEGEIVLIATMETNHILYTVRLIFRSLEELIPLTLETESNRYKNALYGKQTISPEEAADAINSAMHRVYPYLTEILFRFPEIQGDPKSFGIWEEIHSLMKSVFARDAKLEGFKPELEFFNRNLSLGDGRYDRPDDYDESLIDEES